MWIQVSQNVYSVPRSCLVWVQRGGLAKPELAKPEGDSKETAIKARQKLARTNIKRQPVLSLASEDA